jgi:hypothetical protein
LATLKERDIEELRKLKFEREKLFKEEFYEF